jgi:hypothetical protein
LTAGQAEGYAERVAPLANELATLKPDVLVGPSTIVALALKSATATIAIVFIGVADPVGFGLVQSLSYPGGKAMGAELAAYARDDALDYRMIEQSQDAFAFDVTGCRYAEFYEELGEPDLGFLLVCSDDFDMTEGFGSDIKLARTETIMQGASHCDFRYTRFPPKECCSDHL